MKYALFVGCRASGQLQAYELSARAVLDRLGVSLVDLDFDCCGYPARDVNRDAFVAAAARNLALAERAGVDLLVLSSCCFGTLRHAVRFLGEDAALRARVARALAAQGLAWSGKSAVEHLLQVLARDVGFDAIAAAVRAPSPGLRVAAQYGCHALRPSDVTGLDNPVAPTVLETLVSLTGATPVDWPRRLDCCGDPLHQANAALSQRMTRAKIADALESGAEAICSACAHCHVRFDAVQGQGSGPSIRTLLYTQLLGLAMGLSAKSLGL